MFERLRRFFAGKGQPAEPPAPTPAREKPNATPPPVAPAAAVYVPEPAIDSTPVEVLSPPAHAPLETKLPPSVTELKKQSPESVCGIDPKAMDREQIRKRLAELYRRHNQAASSLNEELRKEAEVMLDAIVECRNKYVG